MSSSSTSPAPAPVKRQVIQVPNTFLGLAWAPSGERFYVSGGVDDAVCEYARPARRLRAGAHLQARPRRGPGPGGEARGRRRSRSARTARRLLVANLQNDSVSLIDLATGTVRRAGPAARQIDPAKPGAPGGSFPRAVAWTSPTPRLRRQPSATARSSRSTSPATAIAVGAPHRASTASRSPVAGARQAALRRARQRRRASRCIDTGDAAASSSDVRRGAGARRAAGARRLGGAGTNGLALSRRRAHALRHQRRRERRGGDPPRRRAGRRPRVVGLIPTGWYPTGARRAAGRRQLYVVNGKSNTGPNPAACRINLGIDRARTTTPAGRQPATSGSWRRPAS